MRTIPLDMRAAMLKQETGEVPVFLLTITHPSEDTPIRLSTDPTTRLSVDPLVYGTVSRGETFYYVGMKVTFPDDKERAPPASRFTIFDIHRVTIPMIRSVRSPPPQVKMELVLASDPDTVDIDIPKMEIVNAEYGRDSVSFDCVIDTLINESYPAHSFSPAYFPAIF